MKIDFGSNIKIFLFTRILCKICVADIGKLKKVIKFADDKLFQKIDVPELLNHPTVKKITQIATDDKTQKAVKEGLRQASKVGDKIQDGLNSLFKKPKKKPSFMNFMQK